MSNLEPISRAMRIEVEWSDGQVERFYPNDGDTYPVTPRFVDEVKYAPAADLKPKKGEQV